MYKILSILWGIMLLSGCAMKMSPYHSQRVTQTFFSQPTILVENEKERQLLIKVLSQIVALSPGDLKKKIYPDPNQRGIYHSVLTVLHMYLIPKYPVLLKEAHFYEDVKKSENQELIQETLDRVRGASAISQLK